MKTSSRFLASAICGLMTLQLWATDRELDVVVTPTVIVVNNNAPAFLTVHANIPYQDVILDSARLIIVTPDRKTEIILEPAKTFADECGDLVCKFAAAPVKSAVKLLAKGKQQEIPLVFTVLKLDGTLFFGTSVVRVK